MTPHTHAAHNQLRHEARFYSSDGEIASLVTNFANSGLTEATGAAVLVATGPHLRSFIFGLHCEGASLERSIQEGRLILMDAEDTLAGLLSDGTVSPDALRPVAEAAVTGLTSRGLTPYFYGEMVSLLWQSGQLDQVMVLDELWDSLLDDHDFYLLCGFPSEVADQDDGVTAQIDELHGEGSWLTDGGEDAQWRYHTCLGLEPSDLAPRQARRFVEQTLDDWRFQGDMFAIATVVSELATNAVVHAQTSFSICLAQGRDQEVLVAVVDGASDQIMREAKPDDIGGRGLALVEGLSSEHSIEYLPGFGKMVWAIVPPFQPDQSR